MTPYFNGIYIGNATYASKYKIGANDDFAQISNLSWTLLCYGNLTHIWLNFLSSRVSCINKIMAVVCKLAAVAHLD